MAECARCGKEVLEGETFCRHCGARLGDASPGTVVSGPNAVSEKEFATFVGKNAEKYVGKFRKFGRTGEDSFAPTWHWPAFFFTFWWLIYRKMYVWLIVFLLLGCVPFAGVLVMVFFGLAGNYLYYRFAKKKIVEVKAGFASEIERAAALARAGGVNNVAIVFAPLAVVFAGILAAILIPQFAEYRHHAADLTAKREIQEACRIGEKLFAEHPEKTELEPDELLYAGLVRTPEVEMMLLDGKRETFSISAIHRKGRTLYTTDRECALSEERQPR